MAAATFTSISPTGGVAAGGTSVTITGTNFTGAKSAYVGTLPITEFEVASSTEIKGKTAPNSTDGGNTFKGGAVAITVIGAENTVESSTGEEKYSYWTPPVLQKVNGRTVETLVLGNNKKSASNAVSYGLELSGTTQQNIKLQGDYTHAKALALAFEVGEVTATSGEAVATLESSFDGGTSWEALGNDVKVTVATTSNAAAVVSAKKQEEKPFGALLRVGVKPGKSGNIVIKKLTVVGI